MNIIPITIFKRSTVRIKHTRFVVTNKCCSIYSLDQGIRRHIFFSIKFGLFFELLSEVENEFSTFPSNFWLLIVYNYMIFDFMNIISMQRYTYTFKSCLHHWSVLGLKGSVSSQIGIFHLMHSPSIPKILKS